MVLYCITTLISSAAYVEGANVLAYSIRRHLDAATLEQTVFVAMIIKGSNPVTKLTIINGLKGWQAKEVERVPPVYPDKMKAQYIDTFTKIRCFSWTEYKRVILIDSDFLVMRDISPILNGMGNFTLLSDIAAVRDFERGQLLERFNSGLLSLRPTNQTEAYLLHIMNDSRTWSVSSLQGQPYGDQILLNAAFGTIYQKLPFEYGANLASVIQNISLWGRHKKSLRAIHYTFVKPFDPELHKRKHYKTVAEEISWWQHERDLMNAPVIALTTKQQYPKRSWVIGLTWPVPLIIAILMWFFRRGNETAAGVATEQGHHNKHEK